MTQIINLLKLEYAKFRKNAVIGLLSIMFIILMPIVIFIGKEFDNIDLPDELPLISSIYKFPMVWDYLGYVGNWLVFFFLGLISVFIVVNEISYKTFRQNVIIGMTRKKYFLAKVYSAMAISLIATLYYALIALAIGLSHTKGIELGDIVETGWAIPRFFLMSFGYMSFGLLCAFVFRRSGVAVLFYLCYILMIEHLIKWAMHFRYFNNPTINYYPSNSIEDLMPFPWLWIADFALKIEFSKEINFNLLLNKTESTIASICWIIIFLSIAYRVFTRKDI